MSEMQNQVNKMMPMMRTRRHSSGVVPRTSKCTKCPGCSDGNRQRLHVPKHGGGGRRKKRLIFPKNALANDNDSNVAITEEEVRCNRIDSNNPRASQSVPENTSGSVDGNGKTEVESLDITENEIMKIDTKNYCLFCYKQKGRVGVSDGEEGTEGPNNDTTKKEVCSRYLKLLTRYLNLNIYRHIDTNHQATGTIKRNFFTKSFQKDEGCFDIVVCDACFIIVESFCELYHQLQHVQLQLDWNIVKLKNIMKCAEKVPSRVNEFRENVMEGRNCMKKAEKIVMDGFRREFFRKSIPKRYPKVVLQTTIAKRGARGSKQTKTVLLKRYHGLSNEDEVPSNRISSIEVLKIGQGQELRLNSRSHPCNSIAPTSTTGNAITTKPNQARPTILQNRANQSGSTVSSMKPSSSLSISRPITVNQVTSQIPKEASTQFTQSKVNASPSLTATQTALHESKVRVPPKNPVCPNPAPASRTISSVPAKISRCPVPASRTISSVPAPAKISRCPVPATRTISSVPAPAKISRCPVPATRTISSVPAPAKNSHCPAPATRTISSLPAKISRCPVPATRTISSVPAPAKISRCPVPATRTISSVPAPAKNSHCPAPATRTISSLPAKISRCPVPATRTISSVPAPAKISRCPVPATRTISSGSARNSQGPVAASCTISSANKRTCPGPAIRNIPTAKCGIKSRKILIFRSAPKTKPPISKRTPVPYEVVDLCDSDEDKIEEEDVDRNGCSPAKISKPNQTNSREAFLPAMQSPVQRKEGQCNNDVGGSSSHRKESVNLDNQQTEHINMEVNGCPSPKSVESVTIDPELLVPASPAAVDTSQDFANPFAPTPVSSSVSPSQTTTAAHFTFVQPVSEICTRDENETSNSQVIQQYETLSSSANTNSTFEPLNDVPEAPYQQSPYIQVDYLPGPQPLNDQFNAFNGYDSNEPIPPTHFELPIPPQQPGEGIEITLGPSGPKVTTTFTFTRTITSTFTETQEVPMDENFGIPPMYPTFDPISSHTFNQQPPSDPHFVSQPSTSFEQPFGYASTNNMNSGFFNTPNTENDSSNSTSLEPEPIVTEVEDDKNSTENVGSFQNNVRNLRGGGGDGVVIAELDEEELYVPDDVQIIDATNDNGEGAGEVTVIFQSNVGQSEVNDNDGTHRESNVDSSFSSDVVV